MSVYVHLAEGFEEIEALSVIDVLRRATINVQLISVTKNKIVTGAHKISVEADLLFEEADYTACKMIVLPGGMPGTLNLKAHTGLIQMLSEFHNAEKWIAAICAAPMILGELGMLEQKEATIYPGMEAHLRGAKPVSKRVVCDGKLITAKGPAAAIEFALQIVEKLTDQETRNRLEKDMTIK